MRVLVVGAGAREHSLAWKIAQDTSGPAVFCAPGNGGTAALAENLSVDAQDIEGIVHAVREHEIDFVVIGPEAPLVAGLVDALDAEGVAAFGPPAAAAALEVKTFAKEFMARHGIPTAPFRVFHDADGADAYIRERSCPLVVKADGLAAGKGVVVAKDTAEALAAVQSILREGAFGDAGESIVIEDCLIGEEVSYHVVCDGTGYVALAPAQDHKRALEGDRGPNTGGMGAYSPPPIVDAALEGRIRREIIEPTLAGFRAEGLPFRGALFVGLMICDGDPFVLEYNVRFGDPECECLMARWDGDILPLLLGSARGNLAGVEARWRAPAAMAVVLAAEGYPGPYAKGRPITISSPIEGAEVFHAGTARDGDGWITTGGRVLAVTSVGDTVDGAAERAYAAIDRVSFSGMQFRRDIGHRARTGSGGRAT